MMATRNSSGRCALISILRVKLSPLSASSCAGRGRGEGIAWHVRGRIVTYGRHSRNRERSAGPCLSNGSALRDLTPWPPLHKVERGEERQRPIAGVPPL